MTRQQKPFAQFISISKTKKKRIIILNSYVIWLEFTLRVCMWFEKCQLTTNRKIKRKEKKISYYKGPFEYNLFLLKLETEN